MARVKYTGEIPVLFHDLNRGPVSKDEEFDVPDDEKERYTRRDDIVDLEPDPEPDPEPENETEPAEPANTSEDQLNHTDDSPAEAQAADSIESPVEAVPPTE